MLEPVVSRYVLGGDDHGTVLLHSAADDLRQAQASVPGTGTARAEAYDGNGRLRAVIVARSAVLTVPVYPGGFTVVLR